MANCVTKQLFVDFDKSKNQVVVPKRKSAKTSGSKFMAVKRNVKAASKNEKN